MSDSSSNDTAKKRKVAPQKRELWERVSLHRVIHSYGLGLRKPHNLPPKYTSLLGTDESTNCFDNMESSSIEDVLEILLSFLPSENVPLAKAVLGQVCELGPMECLRKLVNDKSFSQTEGDNSFAAKKMHNLSSKLTTTKQIFESKPTPTKNTVEHSKVKEIFTHFCNDVIVDGTMTKVTCILNISVDNSPKVSPGRPTRKAAPKREEVKSSVAVISDLIIGLDSQKVATPVEIYSPHVYEKDGLCQYHASETETTDGECISLPTFFENLPPFRGPIRSQNQFKYKISVQLVLQLLASCKQYFRNKIIEGYGILKKEKRAFIGVFAHRFDVYLLKLESSESDLYKHLTQEDTDLPLECGNKVTVQFFPVPIDLSNVNHAIAFAVFFSYYNNFYKVV